MDNLYQVFLNAQLHIYAEEPKLRALGASCYYLPDIFRQLSTHYYSTEPPLDYDDRLTHLARVSLYTHNPESLLPLLRSHLP